MNFRLDKIDGRFIDEVKSLLKVVYVKLYDITEKCFYLFEERPHCFFAFCAARDSSRDRILKVVRDIRVIYKQKFSWLKEIYIKWDTNDKDNGDGFIIVMDAMTRYNLIYDDSSYSHIIHCCSNNSFLGGREKELYKLMGKLYR